MSEQELITAAKNGELVSILLHFTKKFDTHTNEEMIRYRDICEQIAENDRLSCERHERTNERIEVLMQSLSSLTQDEREWHRNPCPQLLAAVPDGDLAGHHKAHQVLIKDAEDTDELLKFVRSQKKDKEASSEDRRHVLRGVFTALMTIFVLWVGALIWSGALKGPSAEPAHVSSGGH